jgi:ABC-2 type transport system ATP-binding protein
MITLNNITKRIKQQLILDNISCTFEKGKIYGLRGRNGAGKTMLLRAISGLIKIDSGTITIDGNILRRDIDFPSSLGIMIEHSNLLNEYTGIKNLKLLSKIKQVASDSDIIEAIEKVGLDPNDTKTVRKYSLGMKQRLSIAQAIFEKPDIILMDEPTNAIDVDGVKQVRKILIDERLRGATIIIASHDVDDLNVLADEVITMDKGVLLNNVKA